MKLKASNIAGTGPVREEMREGEVEREGSTRNGWEMGWSLGLVDHGSLERERERGFETRETKSLRWEKKKNLRWQVRGIGEI